MLRLLRYLLILLVVAAVAAGGAVWWLAYRPLPKLDGTASLPELKQEVHVDRDEWGVPRIRASSLEDLALAQGYVVAQDRLWQMDFLRRAASGEVSEIFGPVTLFLDRENRTLGLRQAAEATVAAMDPQSRALVEAYARGVNRYVEERRGRLPWEFVVLGYEPRPWTPADSMLINCYMYKVLTTTWEWELSRARAAAKVGPERARELYAVDSPRDHVLVGAAPEGAPRASAGFGVPDPLALVAKLDEDVERVFGSNNWVVDGRHTYSGKPILANDTHLHLDIPCIWYIVHLQAPGWNVKGFTFPGVPLVIIGHNERIAWGFTNNGADVQDLFIETLNPANPREYLVNGKWTAADVRQETIKVRGRADHAMEVVTTRHGPVVWRQGHRAYALKWTALQPGGLGFVYPLIGSARNWDEFLEIMRRLPGPAQNAVYADVDGNIGYLVAAWIPIRRSGDGSVPVPGDTDAHEWTGYIPFDELPRLLNPPGGRVATANARVVGPGYRHYITDRWAGPHRTERIYALLGQKEKLAPPDCIEVQADIVSPFHLFIAGHLVEAAKRAKPSDPRAAELLTRLPAWDGRAEPDSVEVAFVDYTRYELLRNLLHRHFGDAWPRTYEWWRHVVFTENILRDRPAPWLPREFTSYDELLMASADAAVRRLERVTRSKNPQEWRWGDLIALEILHPLGREGFPRWLLSLGPIPQGGTSHTVKQTGRSIGPAMRFVADLSDWDSSLMNLTAGQSGQWLSPHYTDHFPAWFEGRGLPSPFTDAAWEKARRHRLRLRPGNAR
jgi:penicillin amidase